MNDAFTEETDALQEQDALQEKKFNFG